MPWLWLLLSLASARDLALTFDDPHTADSPPLSGAARDAHIRGALREHGIKAALFVCGSRVDDAAGRRLLQRWRQAGHLLGHHSYCHPNFHSPEVSLQDYQRDFERNERAFGSLFSLPKLFRFPFLKEGDTAAKRDGFRRFLKARGYQIAGVTIDASDWYISDRLRARLQRPPRPPSLRAYRDYYLRHILDRAEYYDGLSQAVLGRSVKHTLVLHHNLLNALFLDDLLSALKARGWNLIDAAEAFQDPVFQERPTTLPAGESVLWSLAKAAPPCEAKLRYPGEDGQYEKKAMDRLGL